MICDIIAVVNPLVDTWYSVYCSQFVEYFDHELTADVYAHGLGGGIL